MKEQFITKKFNAETELLIIEAEKICNRYAAQGYNLSLRQLYYQFVAANKLANTEANYKKLGNTVSDARLAGRLDWDMIKDRGRETTGNPHWNDAAHFMESVAPQFKIDTWEGQPNYVELMVEKQALEGVLEPVCRRLDIRFTANKGYSSQSALYETGKRFESAREDDGKTLHIIYLGDHDPSGIDMTRDVEERVSMFAGGTVEVHRVALNMPQVRKYSPPENPAKLTDSRADAYIRKYGSSSWELDALEPSVLASLVTAQVVALRDDFIYNDVVSRQDNWRQELLDLANKFRDDNADTY